MKPRRRDVVVLILGLVVGAAGCCASGMSRQVEIEGWGVKLKVTGTPVEQQLLVLCSDDPEHVLCQGGPKDEG